MSSRAHAFRCIRRVVGPEICPDINVVQRFVEDVELQQRLDRSRTTAHNLRHMLVSLLLWLEAPERTVCPNCALKLPKHSPNCMLNLLLEEWQR